MAKPPAFQYYPDIFEQGTATLTLAEVGGYQRLLNYQWSNGGIPGDNVKALSQIMRCTPSTAKSVWTQIAGKFARHEDGQWRNDKMERIRAAQAAHREQQANKGRASAVARAHRNSTVVQPDTQPNSNSSSPSSSSLKEEERTATAASRPTLQGRGAHAPNALQRDHLLHVVCGPEMRFCLSERVFNILAPIYNDAPHLTRAALETWTAHMERDVLTPGKSPGDIKWLIAHFTAWLVSLGRVPDAPKTTAGSATLDAIDRWGA